MIVYKDLHGRKVLDGGSVFRVKVTPATVTGHGDGSSAVGGLVHSPSAPLLSMGQSPYLPLLSEDQEPLADIPLIIPN